MYVVCVCVCICVCMWSVWCVCLLSVCRWGMSVCACVWCVYLYVDCVSVCGVCVVSLWHMCLCVWHVCVRASACSVRCVCTWHVWCEYVCAHMQTRRHPFPEVGREPSLGCESPRPSQLGGQPPSPPPRPPWRNRLQQKVHSRETHLPAHNWKHWGKRIFADKGKLGVMATLYHITKEAHPEPSEGPGAGLSLQLLRRPPAWIVWLGP